jgi:hypothetical protein
MILSSRGLKNINFDENTFVFNVNGEQFQVSKFATQFISPAISRSLRTDPTITEFLIGTPSAKECFSYFLSLCEGDSITVEKSMIWRFAVVCRELENNELLSIVVTNDPISSDNITDRLLTVGADSDFEFGRSHFCSLNHSLLSVDILERFLDDPRLRIESEDWLFGIVNSLIAQNSTFMILLDYLELQYLSVSSISRFISHISVESLNSRLLSSIFRRLSLSVSPPILNP